jgi:hypothetical protein
MHAACSVHPPKRGVEDDATLKPFGANGFDMHTVLYLERTKQDG